jgi:hypothetical protein
MTNKNRQKERISFISTRKNIFYGGVNYLHTHPRGSPGHPLITSNTYMASIVVGNHGITNCTPNSVWKCRKINKHHDIKCNVDNNCKVYVM